MLPFRLDTEPSIFILAKEITFKSKTITVWTAISPGLGSSLNPHINRGGAHSISLHVKRKPIQDIGFVLRFSMELEQQGPTKNPSTA
jgi:hypothetical protein